MVRHVLIALVVAPVAVAHADATKEVRRLTQPLGCARLTIAEGLPHSNVGAIVQDRLGFMWFGTQDGLARYDGNKMHVYRPVESDPTSVSSGYITALTPDASGKLWVGTAEHGVNLYDPNTDKFTRISGLSSDGVTTIVRDHKDRIWFAMSEGGINRYDSGNGSVTPYVQKPLDLAVTAMDADAKGNLWLGTASDGVLRWNPDDRTTSSYRPAADGNVLPIAAIRATSDGKVWIGTDGGGLFELDPASQKLTQHRSNPSDPRTLTDDHVSSLWEDHQHTLWVGTRNGLNHREASGQFVRFQFDPEDPDNRVNLAFPEVESIYEDAGGVMWTGGFTVGVCKFTELHRKFGHYRMRGYAKSFFEDPDGTLWVGSLHGLYKYDWKAAQVTIYKDVGQPIYEEDPVAIDSTWLMAVGRDAKGTVWLATGGKGLIAFDPALGSYKQYLPDPDQPNSLPVDTIWDLRVDEGGLWLGTVGGGLVRLDPSTDTFTSFTTDDASGMTSNHVYALYPDPGDKRILWLGTAKGGLLQFNTQTKAVTAAFRHKDEDPTTLSSDDVVSIYREPSGAVWVGTFGGGLNRLDPKTGKAERYTTANSNLTNGAVMGILPGDDGKLWVSTNGGGLLRFDPAAKKFELFESSDGVQDNEFSQGAFLRSRSGALLFGGADGFNRFVPADIKRNSYVPPVVLTSFKVFNQDVTQGNPMWTLPEVNVSYTDSFEVQFAALSFAAPGKNRYAYMLEGFDKDFIETDRPFATYTKLDGGDYTLRVRAANEHGVWNEAGIALEIGVKPPIWKTWPAYGVYAIVLIGTVFLLIRWQRQRLRRVEREGRLAAVERDLALTGAVQTGFLPEHNEIATPHFQLVGFYRPADKCGGDWWWHELVGGRHVVMVGDVTGHGPGPAMVTAAVATAFRVLLENGLESVPHALEVLNREVLRVAKGKYHMTLAALEVDEVTGRWVFHNAGAPPVLSLNEKGKHRVHFCPGAPLGTESGFEVGRAEGQFRAHDRMLLYTDGIPEIALPNGNVMGMRKFAQHFERTRQQPVREAAAAIMLNADQTLGAVPQEDDWTFTVIEWS